MKFGNSKGNNRGKKYMLRRNHDRIPCEGGAVKAENFSEWFADNYHSLINEQVANDKLDYDIMSETYLRMYDGILYGNMNVNDYRAYFSRAYFTNCIQQRMQEAKLNSLDDGYDEPMSETFDPEMERKQKELGEDILIYVYKEYNLREFELFKMYVSLKPAINYRTLGDMTRLKTHQVQNIVSKIKKDICEHAAFTLRRRELTI